MMKGIRVLVVNADESADRIREALSAAHIPIGCIMPVPPDAEKVCWNLSIASHAEFALYDAVVIEESVDQIVAKGIAYAAIDKIPWQNVVIVGKGSLADPAYQVSFVSNMLGLIAELKRMRLIK